MQQGIDIAGDTTALQVDTQREQLIAITDKLRDILHLSFLPGWLHRKLGV